MDGGAAHGHWSCPWMVELPMDNRDAKGQGSVHGQWSCPWMTELPVDDETLCGQWNCPRTTDLSTEERASHGRWSCPWMMEPPRVMVAGTVSSNLPRLQTQTDTSALPGPPLSLSPCVSPSHPPSSLLEFSNYTTDTQETHGMGRKEREVGRGQIHAWELTEQRKFALRLRE